MSKHIILGAYLIQNSNLVKETRKNTIKPIKVFNDGNMIRDFTYIDDIIESVIRVIDKPPVDNPNFDKSNPNSATSWAPHKVFNIGNSDPVPLMSFIKAIEDAVGIKAIKNFQPIQPGDVPATHADTKLLEKWIDFKPETSIKKGIEIFVEWYKNFYNL